MGSDLTRCYGPPTCCSKASKNIQTTRASESALNRPLVIQELQAQSLQAIACGELVSHRGEALKAAICADDSYKLELFRGRIHSDARAAQADILRKGDFLPERLARLAEVLYHYGFGSLIARLPAAV